MCQRGHEVFKSADGGLTWTPFPLPNEYGYSLQGSSAINSPHPNEMIVGGDNGVFYSEDKGATWTNLSADLLVKSIRGVFIDGPGRKVCIGTRGAGVCQRSF